MGAKGAAAADRLQAVAASPGHAVPLPAPRTAGSLSLEEALARRRSTRKFAPRRLSLTEISQLLWAGQGRTGRSGERTAPSAGALHPLELYVLTPDALYRYSSSHHSLDVIAARDLRRSLGRAALDQEAVSTAPAVLVLAAVYTRTAAIYGRRAKRYVRLEAGHATQNVLLQGVALGLGAVPIGAFDDLRVQRILGIPGDHEPLYLVPVGEDAE